MAHDHVAMLKDSVKACNKLAHVIWVKIVSNFGRPETLALIRFRIEHFNPYQFFLSPLSSHPTIADHSVSAPYACPPHS